MRFPYSQGRTLDMKHTSTFASIIQESSRRALTNQQDVLRALAGLIRRSSKVRRNDFLYGIPVDEISAYLAFKGDNRILRRREGFPSYSWAGWQGSILIPSTLSARSPCWIRWWITSPTTGQRRGPFRQPFQQRGFLHRELARMNLSTDILYHLRTTKQPSMLEPKPFALDKSPPTYLSYELLQFWTICQKSRAFVYDTVRTKAHLLDDSGTVQGVVNLDGFNDGDDAYWQLIKTECFLAVLGAVDLSFSYGHFKDWVEELERVAPEVPARRVYDSCEYYVVLVLKCVEQPSSRAGSAVYERRGIGIIKSDLITSRCGLSTWPAWHHVCLA